MSAFKWLDRVHFLGNSIYYLDFYKYNNQGYLFNNLQRFNNKKR